jgi:D-tyrosyl-tRNA(Tyr) deacylase
MRAVVQRVTRAEVRVDGEVIGSIGTGVCVLVGAAAGDRAEDAFALADKIANLRIFEDDEGKMNQSLLEIGGAMLAISQFTLLGDARRGRRPSFVDAMAPEPAQALYEAFLQGARDAGVPRVQSGRFRADMAVELVNDGPVTILLDTKKTF